MSHELQNNYCIVCKHKMEPGIQPWHMECPKCGYESGALEPAINERDMHQAIHEGDREIGLKALRVENFGEIMKLIKSYAHADAQFLLDVGAAHGWFLEQARDRFTVLGVEPDIAVGSQTAAKGIPIREGYFPQALRPNEIFDIIVFNDVIEHIPNLQGAISACNERLRENGILVLNLPNSRGLFYKLSKLFARLGWNGPFERMWQKGFPSPHVHFFNSQNLSSLVGMHGFSLLTDIELPSIRAKGLMQRIRYANNASSLNFCLQYLGSMFALPWTRVFPSDVIVCVYLRR
ncbi:MAG: methyltransferase [Burkholderiales bacterium RIFCSPLOWO2_02_FULL_57_36]|nr:MAG: methyltransferase [Burkholderiales bacterium RIFCSPLOWO2_02_FULL_57_36]